MWLHQTYFPMLVQYTEGVTFGFEDDADSLIADLGVRSSQHTE